MIGYNYVLTCGIVSWVSAQVIKTILFYIENRQFKKERLVGAGGMPSSHSALVCSATIAVARKATVSSPEFAIIFILACIVMYDAMGVRRAAGIHAREINKMNKLFENIYEGQLVSEDDKNNKELKEFLGHTPLQVLGGALLGIVIALFIPIG